MENNHEEIKKGDTLNIHVNVTKGKEICQEVIRGRVTSVGLGGLWFTLVGRKSVALNSDNIGNVIQLGPFFFRYKRIKQGRRVFLEKISQNTAAKIIDGIEEEGACPLLARDNAVSEILGCRPELVREAVDYGCQTIDDIRGYIERPFISYVIKKALERSRVLLLEAPQNV